MNRKIKFSILLVLCVVLTGGMLLFGMNTLKAEATEREITASGTSGSISWTFYSDGELVISGEGYTGTAWKQKVTNTSVTKVTLEDGITGISYGAFNGYSKMTDITIPNGIESILRYAFDNCTSLKNVYFKGDVSDWLSIGFTFADATPLKYAESLYIDNKLVTDLVIPDGVTTVCARAFYNYSKLESVCIPDTVTAIGVNAFYGCSGLTSITVPDSVTKMGNGVFTGCTGLKNVAISNNIINLGTSAFEGCTGLTEVEIPYGVNIIDNKAFSGCTGLSEVKLPNSITSIGISAFSNCSFKNINTPENCLSIHSGAFANCANLYGISLPESIEYIGQNAFANTAFYNDQANWDNGFLYIGNNLIATDEEKISSDCVLYSKTKLIASRAFYWNDNIESITIPNNVEFVNDEVFYNCDKLETVNFSKNLKIIGEGAFNSCDALKEIEIPDTVLMISEDAFYSCDSIEKVRIYEGLTGIGSLAFASIPALTEIHIPKTVTSLASDAFKSSGITDIYYGDSKAEWKRLANGATFNDATVHYTLRSDDESVIIHHTDNNFDWEAGNVHLVVEDLGNASSSYEQNGFYNRLMVDPIQVLDIKLVDGDGNDIQPLSDEKITVKIKASEEFKALMKNGVTAVSDYDVDAENINFINDCFVFAVNGETVSVPADESFLKKFKIIHWYSDAVEPTDHESFTHDEISVENGYIALETNHFSEYAVCTEYVPKKDYTIKWFVDGVVTEQTVTEEAAITKPENPEKEGYTFIGWAPEVPDTMPAENLEFTAVWQANKYTITFDTAGGTAIAPITLEYGAAITSPANPEKEGFAFVGWTPELPETMPANDLTVVAEYEEAKTPDIPDTPDKPEITVTGIKIISLPNKTKYTYKADGLDLSGIAVEEMYSDGTSKIITDTNAFTAYGFNADSVGTKTITVVYGNYTDEFEITVSYAWWQWIIRILLLGFIWY